MMFRHNVAIFMQKPTNKFDFHEVFISGALEQISSTLLCFELESDVTGRSASKSRKSNGFVSLMKGYNVVKQI